MPTTKQPETDVVESADAARILNVTPNYVRRLAQRGLLHAYLTTPRGTRLFQRSVVMELASARKKRRGRKSGAAA
jgi:DNA-binding transcriptional MerR regulator